MAELPGKVLADIAACNPCRRRGRLHRVTGPVLTASLPGARIGERVLLGGGRLSAEVIGFREELAVLRAAGSCRDLRSGDVVWARGERFSIPFSPALLGRVVDSLAQPLDGRPAPPTASRLELECPPPDPLRRRPITQIKHTGIKIVDCLTTLGRGQRVGLFAEPGVGKSTLLAQLARQCQAEVVVLALVGERGREVRQFIEDGLGPQGLARSVVVCATADRPAAERARAVATATALAGAFRGRGRDVLLLVDSLTRHARAHRELALAAGEFPGRRGFPPSVFEGLSVLLERAGNDDRGSVTAIYTVLTDGQAEDDPLAEEVRSLLDGHLVLSRQLAAAGVFPALDPLRSLSRLMNDLVTAEQAELARRLRASWSTYQSHREAIECGLYQPGADAEVDQALARQPMLLEWLRQGPEQPVAPDDAWRQLRAALAAGP